MRRFWLPLCGLLLTSAWLPAQQPTIDPNAAMAEDVLGKWEKAMTNMSSVLTDCHRITIKKAFKTVEKYSGEARMLKSNTANQPCRASLALFKEGRPEVFDKVVCTGTHVFIFDSLNKTIKYTDQPGPGKGMLTDNNFLDFLFGMKAGEAKYRYQFIYVPPGKDDKWYHYLKIIPRNEQDKRAFKEARVALSASTYLPRQLWFLQANEDEVTWDFPHLSPNSQLVRPQDFQTPDTPNGWQMQKMQK